MKELQGQLNLKTPGEGAQGKKQMDLCSKNSRSTKNSTTLW